MAVFHVIVLVVVLDDEIEIIVGNVLQTFKVLSETDATNFLEDFIMT